MIPLSCSALPACQPQREVRKFAMLIENVSDAFVGVDGNGVITDWNAKASQLLGWSAGEAVGRPMSSLLAPERAGAERDGGFARLLAMADQAGDKPVEVPLPHRDGHEILAELTIGAVRDEDTQYVAIFMRDISARKNLEARLQFQATHDSLTGLPNRAEFLARLHHCVDLRQSGRAGGRPLLLFIDLDGFKAVNDQLGHAAGDRVLAAFAATLRRGMREPDMLARLAGDEFVILVEPGSGGGGDPRRLHNVARRAAAQAGQAVGVVLDASVGVAVYTPGETAERLLARADEAMYAAKRTHTGALAWHGAPGALPMAVPVDPVPAAQRSEDLRLAALHATQLLDTPPEEMFDQLTRAASLALGMPMALVSLVDAERQWFKSRCGVDAAETARSASICTHTIECDGMLVVPDARLDERFAASPLVTGAPHIRFYAGVPLLARDRQPIGTLCVLDTVPRAFSGKDRAILRALAGSVQELIRLRLATLASTALLAGEGGVRGQAGASELGALLTRDPLTGLPNRAEFEDAIRAALPEWLARERLAAMAIVDIDNFNGVNSALGYRGGDRLLVELSKRLRAAVGEHDLIARIGGDAFVVLLCQQDGGDDLSQRLDALWRAAQFGIAIDGREVAISSCIGFSRFPADGDAADVLINAAFAALRQAKSAGRAALQPYYAGAAMPDRDYLLERDLRHAIDHHELVLHYQPKVDLLTQRIVGVEALVRWRHPLRGLVGPGDFIPLAEQTGLIVAMSEWIIDEACAELARWRARGVTEVSMGINLSSRLFATCGLVQLIESALRRHGLPGQALDLEVTESGSMADPLLASRLMRQLKALGPTISVDDFGTGYSSLSYLKDFPIDAIKIDRSFVVDMLANEGTLAILQGMIATARRLGLAIVAEGVETPEQRDLLLREHCDIYQGFLFSRPLPGDVCLALLVPAVAV